MTRVAHKLGIAAIAMVLMSALLYACYPFVRPVMLATTTDTDNNQYILSGQKEGVIGGWFIKLYWRRNNGYWLRYYIDHESEYLHDVCLTVNEGVMRIVSRGQVVCSLDTSTGILFFPNGEVAAYATEVITSNNPWDDAATYTKYSPNWRELYAEAMNGAKYRGPDH